MCRLEDCRGRNLGEANWIVHSVRSGERMGGGVPTEEEQDTGASVGSAEEEVSEGDLITFFYEGEILSFVT
jgi:hypothetical protein